MQLLGQRRSCWGNDAKARQGAGALQRDGHRRRQSVLQVVDELPVGLLAELLWPYLAATALDDLPAVQQFKFVATGSREWPFADGAVLAADAACGERERHGVGAQREVFECRVLAIDLDEALLPFGGRCELVARWR